MNVAVLGGGNGAFAAAADLSLRGHQVSLCEVPELAPSLAGLRKSGTIDVDALPTTGLQCGTARLRLVTDDPGRALADCQVALLIVPSFALRRFADFVAGALRHDHVLLLMPGNLWGAYRVAARLRASGAPAGVLVGEAECMVYAARKTGANAVAIRGYKHHLGVAAADANRSGELHARLEALYPTVRQLGSVLQTGLNNVNPFFHPLILLCNLGLAEASPPRRFYAEGVSPIVALLIERLDEERLAVGRALGVSLPPLRDLLLRWYAHEGAAGESLHAVLHSVPAYRHSLFPPSLATSRYLLEDVPFGLVPFLWLARRLAVPTPLCETLIALAERAAAAAGAALPSAEAVDLDEFVRRAAGAGVAARQR